MQFELDRLISVPKLKLDQIKHMLWTDFEDILVAIQGKIQVPSKKKDFDGFLIITTGAIYIFKKKILVDPVFVTKFTILDCEKMKISNPEFIEFVLDEGNVIVHTSSGENIAKILARFEKRSFWDLPFVQLMEFDKTINLEGYTINSRQSFSLRDRAILMAHFYGYYQEDTSVFNYLQLWDTNPTSILILTNQFKPGIYAAAVGHAIAWEKSLESIIVQKIKKDYIGNTLSAIIENAISIEKIGFSFYTPKAVPEFLLKHIHNPKMNSFWFTCCSVNFIKRFFGQVAKGIPPISGEICISKIDLVKNEFKELVNSICQAKSAHQITKMRLSQIKQAEKFPFDDLTRLLMKTEKLEQLVISNINVEGADLMYSICASQSNLKRIKIEFVTFSKQIDVNTKLPPKLVYLSLSRCTMMKSSFLASLLLLLTKNKTQFPIAFAAHCMNFGKGTHKAFSMLNLSRCKPNFLEFDWSNNLIPKSAAEPFCRFLETQTRLQLVILQNIKLQNTEQFWTYLMQLVMRNSLRGLEVTGKFPSAIFVRLIESIGNAQFIERLNLRSSYAHDDGLNALTEAIKKLPNLREISADGYKPSTSEAFFNFWNEVLSHPSIHSAEIPTFDIAYLRKNKLAKGKELRLMQNLISQKGKPSTMLQRAILYSEQVDTAEDFATTASAIFSSRYTGNYFGDSDNDNEDEEIFGTKRM